LAALALVSGCTSRPISVSADASGIPAIELTAVPFFPQQQYQCGPAALATVLVFSGVHVAPDALAPRIYLPARRGSLQMELIAAARQLERVPYVIDPTLEAIHAEIRAGRPVLVLQNLGLRTFPRWHYAVVVGADEPARALTLRSGDRERVTMSESRFSRTWARADRWAMVTLRPGELPAVPDPAGLIAAAAALESLGRLKSARAAFLAVVTHWPEEATAWFGLGNTEYRLGAYPAAEAAYRRVLARSPVHAAALNNLAQLMSDRGCPADARQLLKRARAAADSESVMNAIAATETALQPAGSASSAACEPIEAPFPR
jgi:tetratricopeptide (TPR) repeat protein